MLIYPIVRISSIMGDNASMDDIVIMRVKRRTRYLLSLIGSKAETYDEIITRVLREAGYLDDEGNLIKR